MKRFPILKILSVEPFHLSDSPYFSLIFWTVNHKINQAPTIRMVNPTTPRIQKDNPLFIHPKTQTNQAHPDAVKSMKKQPGNEKDVQHQEDGAAG